jgi:inhibitor of KinA
VPLFEAPRVLRLGDASLTVQFGDEVSDAAHERVVGFLGALDNAIASGLLAGTVDRVAAYASVTVHWDSLSLSDLATEQSREATLLALAQSAAPSSKAGNEWEIPVCFAPEFAQDLTELAQAKGLQPQEVIRLLVGATYRVYMLGFLPGFAFMGGVPEVLAMSRRATPRASVPQRSMAIAGRMAGVYPWASPGGWHLMGRTPVRYFDAKHAQPALLGAGDVVRWKAIDLETYNTLEAQAQSGRQDRDQFRRRAAPA